MDRELCTLRTENASAKAAFAQERQRLQSHEKRIVLQESVIDQLNKKLKSRDQEIANLQTQLNQKQQLINQKDLEKEKQKKRLNSRFAVEKDRIETELETKLMQQKYELNVSVYHIFPRTSVNCSSREHYSIFLLTISYFVCRTKCATKRTN